MSNDFVSTTGSASHRRPSLAGSTTSHGSLEDYQPDGREKMTKLFDSVMGSTSGANPGDQTIRPSHASTSQAGTNTLRTDRAATAPVGSSSGTFIPTGPAPSQEHQAPINPIPPHLRHDRPAQHQDQNNNETADERDYRLAELKLKANKLVSSTVASIVTGIKKEDQLLPDGSNFGQWMRSLRELSRTGLSGSEFFFQPCNSKTFERIGRAVLLASVHASLVPDLQSIDTAYNMYLSLKKKFKTVSRAAQMNIWRRFMAFRVDPNAPSAGIASTLLDLYAEWKSVNVSCRADSFLGFILQAAVMQSGAPYRLDFENRLENTIQFDPNNACPTFAAICNAYDISRQQHLHSSDQAQNPAGSVFAPAALLTSASVDDFDANMFLTGVDEGDWCDALDFFALTAAKCWSCGGENHYQRDCPHKGKQSQSGRPSGGSQAIGTIVGTIYGQLPSGYQVTSSRFPNYSARRSLAPPHQQPKPGQTNGRLLPTKVPVQISRRSSDIKWQHSKSTFGWGGSGTNRGAGGLARRPG
ncbi:hypothetical protein PGTUg99_050058 [Puccinia graminis f. sp. tritici]|uniref:CCHC-type domain-containing protein n=1 Tax=Puccinia graminis f. sp. tritici TaxID=56615 RepID=A0A5B0MK23_PUCGR|nr:hypothetical protein PGTUg99_050058 [Puccinia graminis f. sp. tritici]